MFVEMLQSVGTFEGPFTAGETYDVAEGIALSWINTRYAKPTKTPPPEIAKLLARLDDGAGLPCLFLPFVGEFGHQMMSHVRIVNFHRASSKIVCCRVGEEVLYPSADACFTDWFDHVPDNLRIATMRETEIDWSSIEQRFPGLHPIPAGRLTPTQEIFPIYADRPILFRPRIRGIYADVVLSVRRREFAPERNWKHWQTLANALRDAGYTFAVAGGQSGSFNLSGQCFHTGYDFADTDSAIELMQKCKLYIGTDSGGSHLASTVGCNMLLFRELRSGSRDMTARMARVNSGNTRIVGDGWANPNSVVSAALEILKG